MTTLRRLDVIRLLTFSVLLLVPITACSQRRPAAVEQLAKTYGIDSFDQVDALRYTFNVQFPNVNLARSWVWEPKTGQVSYEGKDKDGKPVKTTYVRSQLSSQSDLVKDVVDPGFVNDNYWFLFPFHAYWDHAADVQNKGTQPLPLGNGSADLVSVKYPSDAGYTPGDTWNLFVGKDDRIEQLLFQHGGTKKPSVVMATWEGYKKAGPLLVSTEHRGTADGGPLHLFFSDVAVKLTGSNTWTDAQ
jgi:hypothetical protein